MEIENATALIHQIRHKCEHSIPTTAASQRKYLEAGMTSWSPSLKFSDGKDVSRVHFLCLPYFSLKPYTSDDYTTTADVHPTRSLLQTQYPLVAVERETQQAICRLQSSDQQRCFHVYQVWCLYVENGMSHCQKPPSHSLADCYRASCHVF